MITTFGIKVIVESQPKGEVWVMVMVPVPGVPQITEIEEPVVDPKMVPPVTLQLYVSPATAVTL